ncbi:MAG: carbohydrate ABC transporter permease [Chloroflexota bacterium]
MTAQNNSNTQDFFGDLTWQTIVGRLVAYILLTFFGFLMIFPFLYMAFTSFKTSDDVFRFPPALLPYTQATTDVEGEELRLYDFTLDGEDVQLVSTGENTRFGFFTTPDLILPTDERNSQLVAELPLDDTVETGDIIEYLVITEDATPEDAEALEALRDENGVLTGEIPESIRTDAYDIEDFDLYTATIDGVEQELVLAYRGSKTLFIDPDDPTNLDRQTFAVERTATPVEFVEFQVDNYDAFFDLNLDRSLVNTSLVTFLVVVGQLITSIFGGYAFSRVKFRGRDTLFLAYLGSIMIPFVVLIIPIYRLMVILDWNNQLVSLIVPWIFTAYGTFLMRQFFISIPKEIEEAALLDGASRFRILWQIFVPLSKPAIATLAIFSFLYAWNSFLWPLLIIGEGNEMNHVLTLSLIRLSNVAADRPNIVLTGAAIAILPPMVIFVFAQKYFIEGVASSGLKG